MAVPYYDDTLVVTAFPNDSQPLMVLRNDQLDMISVYDYAIEDETGEDFILETSNSTIDVYELAVDDTLTVFDNHNEVAALVGNKTVVDDTLVLSDNHI